MKRCKWFLKCIFTYTKWFFIYTKWCFDKLIQRIGGWRRFVLVLLIAFILWNIWNHYPLRPPRYFNDIQSALEYHFDTDSIRIIDTIQTENHPATISIIYNGISVSVIHSGEQNGQTMYRVGNGTSVMISETSMMKMNTIPDSAEQIAFGIGREAAQEFVELSGIEAEFISFEHRGNQYEMWYIISIEGLAELPDFRMQGINSYEFPDNRYAIIFFITILLMFVVAIYYKSKKTKFRRLTKNL